MQAPRNVEEARSLGADFWTLAIARELEDAILHLRFNEDTVSTWIFRTRGDSTIVKSHDAFLAANADDWLVREIRLYLKRTLKRLDVSSRSIFALIEPGSCFCGTLLNWRWPRIVRTCCAGRGKETSRCRRVSA